MNMFNHPPKSSMKQTEGIRSQKSTSQTFLADGTKISTTEVIETDPNTNIQVETTTVIKEYVKETEMERGQILVEDVKETTTTRREWRIRDKCEDGVEVVGMTVGFSLPICGYKKDVNDAVSLLKDSDDDDESSNGSKLTVGSLLSTFPKGKKDKSKSSIADNSKSSGSLPVVDEKKVSKEVSTKIASDVNEEPRTKSNVASSAFAMLTSPASFFRKTNLSLNTNENTDIPQSNQEVEDSKNLSTSTQASTTSEQRENVTSQASTTSDAKVKAASQASAISESKDVSKKSKASFDLDETILNIIKKDVHKESRASPVETSQQKQNLPQPPLTQSRETAPSKCVDKEEREGNTSSSRGLAAPSPTLSVPSLSPSMTNAPAKLTKPSSQSLLAPLASTPTLTNSSSSKLSKHASAKVKKQDTKPTTIKHVQTLLPQESDFAAPKLTLSSTTAAVTDDKYLHFFSFQSPSQSSGDALQSPKPARQLATGKWRKSTTVSIENTYCMNVNISGNTAVVGVPYDRNIKGLLTGAAYIFEREDEKDIWTQVKKIVPKEISEFATVGFAVGIWGDLIAVSVPNVGSTAGGGTGGSVYLYRRVQKYKWAEKGVLTPPSVETANNGGKAPGAAITVVNKSKKGVSKKKKFGTKLAVQENVVVVSDHYDHEETAVCVFEYDDFSLQWTCIQDNLLSESQQRHFGSRLALTNKGNGILIGCHAKMTPTEVLYYSRYGSGGKFHLQQVIVISKRSSSYGVGRGVAGKNGVTEDISDFKVDGKNLIISTTSSLGQQNQHCVYIYQLQTNDTWVLMAKVDNPDIQGFGQCVGLSGNRVLIASRGNAYSYTLEKLIPKSKRKEFMATVNLAEEKKKRDQPKPQVKYIDPEYLEVPYIGSDLNDFRNKNQAVLQNFNQRSAPINSNNSKGGDKSSQNSTASPSRMSLTMARPTKSRMSRMRSPSPILRRLRGSSLKRRKENVSAPPLRPTYY